MTDKGFLLGEYHTDKWFEPGAWQELMLAGAAIKSRVFVTLAKRPMSAAGLADALALDERAATIFLQALAGAGYLASANGEFILTPAARSKFGDERAPGYLGWAVLHSWRLAQRWLTLPEVLQSGAPAPGDRFSESVEGFVRAMDVFAAPMTATIIDACLNRAPEAKRVLDIGGATGTISKAFAERGLKSTLFDIPEVIETIHEEMKTGWPSVELAGGDFNQSLPPGPFDIIFLGNVVHIYGPEMNRALFKRVHDALAPGGAIAILDYVRERSDSAPFFGVNMLVNTTEGGTWTEKEYSDWLRDAGFADIEVIDLTSRDQQLIIASHPLGSAPPT